MSKLLLPCLLALAACGSTPKPAQDAGTIDTSCGLDCDAQAYFGLQVGTCFSYTDTNAAQTPPSLGVEVRAVTTLENGVKALQLVYTQTGQQKMRDLVTLEGGSLQLVRREFGAGGASVTWLDDTGKLKGIPWLERSTVAAQTIETSGKARSLSGGNTTEAAASFKITTVAPTTSESTVPYGAVTDAFTLLGSTTPDGLGADPRRVFTPSLGFSLISTAFSASGNALPYKLQKVRLPGADAGTEACGF
jgi:hypothetical protein